jgi:hypothetical protein
MSPLWLAQMCEWPSGASCFSTTRGGIGTHCPSSRAYQRPILIEEGAGRPAIALDTGRRAVATGEAGVQLCEVLVPVVVVA